MRRLRENPWISVLVICLGFFMIMLDTTIVYVATPSILSGLHTSLDQVLWVFNGYLLAYAVLLITAGRLGDIYGPRNLFGIGLAIFTLASAASGFSQDSTQLIAARVVQGVGGALLAPQSLAMLTLLFPPERRGAALGVWGGVVGLSTAAGPTLGGLIITYANWPWIFFVNVPVGVIALIATFTVLPDLRPGRSHRLDVPGVLLASAGLLAIVYALIEGQRYDWGTVVGFVTIPEIIGVGVVLLLAFLAFESRQEEPLIPVRLFRNRNFSLMSWTGAAMAFGMQGIFIPLSIYTQSVLGMTALLSGLTFAPMSLTSAGIAPAAGRLADRLGGRYLVMTGLALFAGGAALTVLVAGTSSTWLTFLGPLIVAGAGLGLIFAPMTTVAMHDITPQMAGAASSVLNTTRQLGAVIGSAVVGAVLQNQLATAFRARAVIDSAELPTTFRQQFVDGFAAAARSGFQVGRGQTGGAQPPAGLPAQAVAEVQRLVHDVFVNGYVAAMRPTVMVAVVALLIASLSCLAVVNRVRTGAVESEQIAA